MTKEKTEKTDSILNDQDEVYKVDEYKKFALWLSLPSIMKGTDKDALKMQRVAGFDDEEIMELLSLETKGDFAKKYNVDKGTLSKWVHRLKGSPMFDDIKVWVNGLIKNVVLSTYRSAMSNDPKAHNDRKLILQIGGWVEKLSVDHSAEGLAGVIKKELASFRQEHEQPTDTGK